ncbi:hypothetical protein B0J13DRAFT_520279 [Dactylonectria estremocensis]|uniref:Uncharacterized protein n=1 Tax=Dactylonectria estremocensis TaxID=1079267 RepID=A0A9P9FBQ3_9HYPO|nr:hypothetical protein B0J13DRAFT_520279 [Dactylonectria estremocensis]
MVGPRPSVPLCPPLQRQTSYPPLWPVWSPLCHFTRGRGNYHAALVCMGFGYCALVRPLNEPSDKPILHPQCLDPDPLLTGLPYEPIARDPERNPRLDHRGGGGGVGIGAQRGREQERNGKWEGKVAAESQKINQEGQKTHYHVVGASVVRRWSRWPRALTLRLIRDRLVAASSMCRGGVA